MSKSGCFCIVELRLTFFSSDWSTFFKENFKDVLNSTSISQQGKKITLLFYHIFLLLTLTSATKSENHIQLQNVT